MGKLFKSTFLVILALSVAACGNLPRGAAIEAEIVRGADDADADFAIYPVTKAFLPSVAHWPVTGDRSYNWIGHSHGSSSQIIQTGDTLDVIIWDSSENSLITSPTERVANLRGMRVSGSGSIFVPYIGKVHVAGRSPDSARQLVQRKLEAIVPSAQVQLQMTEGRTNSVDVVSGVKQPGSIAMPNNDFSVLGAISAAGGVTAGIENPQVKLIRGHKIYRTSISTLYDNPKKDTRLRGGDKVIVEEDRRYFLSLGAAGREAQFKFNRETVNSLFLYARQVDQLWDKFDSLAAGVLPESRRTELNEAAQDETALTTSPTGCVPTLGEGGFRCGLVYVDMPEGDAAAGKLKVRMTRSGKPFEKDLFVGQDLRQNASNYVILTNPEQSAGVLGQRKNAFASYRRDLAEISRLMDSTLETQGSLEKGLGAVAGLEEITSF